MNELIHLFKKYRSPFNSTTGLHDGCNMCLMLGVQNNSRDEVHLRINIQNCTKLTIKTFYFPSMKNIIFEVINVMLLTKTSPSALLMPLSFSQKAIENLIEMINMYGMSIDKFKRTLRLMLIENIYDNPYCFVHLVCLENKKLQFRQAQFDKKVLVQHKD